MDIFIGSEYQIQGENPLLSDSDRSEFLLEFEIESSSTGCAHEDRHGEEVASENWRILSVKF